MHFKLSDQHEPANDSNDDQGGAVGYLYLTRHPSAQTAGCVKKQIRLLTLIKDYKGPDIYLDFDASNELIGIEILEDDPE